MYDNSLKTCGTPALPSVAKRGQIEEEIEAMRGEIVRALTLARRLRENLEPVLRGPEPECVGAVANGLAFPSVPMAQVLREMRGELESVNSTMQDIQNRLGL
jgi:hypothetical protein